VWLNRYDESWASRYGFLRDGGGNGDRLNDLACGRSGAHKAIEIIKATRPKQAAPASTPLSQRAASTLEVAPAEIAIGDHIAWDEGFCNAGRVFDITGGYVLGDCAGTV